MQKFTPSEFLSKLAKDDFAEPATAVAIGGLVKASSSNEREIDFSANLSCTSWVAIPVEIVESITQLQMVTCKDHKHPLVNLTLKTGTSPETRALVGIVAALQNQLSFLARRAPARKRPMSINNNNVECELVSTDQGLFLCCLGGSGEVECTDVLTILKPE